MPDLENPVGNASMFARLRGSQAGAALPNTYALLDGNGQFGVNARGNGKSWYVDTYAGSDNNNGKSWGQAFATVAYAFTFMGNYDVLFINGVVKEQVTAPQDIFECTIVGAANRPRQATDAGVATGGGACWLSPASPAATTPLLKLREQAWTIMNILFAPVASSACIRLSRAETAADMDASHASIIGCRFAGGGAAGIGIEDVGGCSNVLIEGCSFHDLAGTAIKGISTGIAVPLGWEIKGNKFRQNGKDITMSLNYALIEHNTFFTAFAGSAEIINTKFVSAQGSLNIVRLNQFPDIAADIVPAKGYTGTANDTWSNYVLSTAALIVVSPPT